MTEEKIEAKKKYAEEKKAPIKHRGDHHDYTDHMHGILFVQAQPSPANSPYRPSLPRVIMI